MTCKDKESYDSTPSCTFELSKESKDPQALQGGEESQDALSW